MWYSCNPIVLAQHSSASIKALSAASDSLADDDLSVNTREMA